MEYFLIPNYITSSAIVCVNPRVNIYRKFGIGKLSNELSQNGHLSKFEKCESTNG